MENTKQYRVLEIFFRGLRGENLSVQELANEYGVSTKSVTRSINELKDFLADPVDHIQLTLFFPQAVDWIVAIELLFVSNINTSG